MPHFFQEMQPVGGGATFGPDLLIDISARGKPVSPDRYCLVSWPNDHYLGNGRRRRTLGFSSVAGFDPLNQKVSSPQGNAGSNRVCHTHSATSRPPPPPPPSTPSQMMVGWSGCLVHLHKSTCTLSGGREEAVSISTTTT